MLATGADDGSVGLWYVSGGGQAQLEPTQAKLLHSDGVRGVAAAPGEPRLASASADGTLRLWDCAQLLACTSQLGAPGDAAQHAVAWAASPALLASASHAGRLCLWDARQLGSAPAAAAAVGAPALSLAVAAAGAQALLVAGDELGRVSVFDPRSLAQPMQQQQLHGDAVHALAAGGGGRVAAGSDDGGVSLFAVGGAAAAAPRLAVPPRGDGEAPCYIRALAWQQERLFRGGWDQAVGEVQV
jgi:WD40 repeat protein